MSDDVTIPIRGLPGWSCTADSAVFPGCGICAPCRQALAAGWRCRSRFRAAQAAESLLRSETVDIGSIRLSLLPDPEVAP